MNKAELIDEVQRQLGDDTSKATATQAINVVFEAIKKGIEKENSVQIIGFGTFSVVKRKARTGINPQTKEKIRIKASKAVKFKPSLNLKTLIN